jgi:hypothetical protein
MIPLFHNPVGLTDMATAKQASEDTLQITVPPVTKKSLRLRAAETGDPMRLIVLRALAAAGIQVPTKELQDRRRTK